jgi:antitoxin ParD1/3/4
MDERPQLGPEDEAFIEEAVRSGRYGSRALVLHEALGQLRRHEAQWARFQAEIQKGIDSLDRGEGIPLEEAFDELDAYIDQLATDRERKSAA